MVKTPYLYQLGTLLPSIQQLPDCEYLCLVQHEIPALSRMALPQTQLSVLCASLPFPAHTHHAHLWPGLCLKTLLPSIVTSESEGALVSFPCVGMKNRDRP